MVADGVAAATAAVEHWLGGHAVTFVEEINPFLISLAQLVEHVRWTKQRVAAWPEPPWILDTITGRLEALSHAIAVPTTPGAAHHLRAGVNNYGLTEVAAAPDRGEERTARLMDLGRVQNTVNVAQNEALTSAAEAEIEAALDDPGLGLTPGRALDHHISTIPWPIVGDVPASINDLAGALGVSAGSLVDNVFDSPPGTDPLDGLDQAERIHQARLAESAVNRAVWLAEDRFANPDQGLLDTAAGQPFLDSNGRLKTDPSLEEVHAFRDWAIEEATHGGVLVDDSNRLRGGAHQINEQARDHEVGSECFESDPAVRAAAAGEPFTDDTGALKPRLTESETEAFEAGP